MKRTPLSRGNNSNLTGRVKLNRGKPLESKTKLSGGGKLRAKKKTLEQVQEQKEIAQMTREADRRFCEQLWASRGGKSEVSGIWLGEPNWACVHHLLPKSKFPVYRYEDWNVILLTIDEHAATENGNPPEIVKQRTEAVKQRYGI
jgi:hypothetical protein